MSDLTNLFNEANSEDLGLEQFEPVLSEDTSLFYLDRVDAPLYRLFMEDFIPGRPGIHKVHNHLLEAPSNAQLELRISSNGGSVDEGARLISLMENHFPDRTVGYLESKGYSMGAILFSYCDTRIIYPTSNLMYHNYSAFLMGKGGEIKDRTENTQDRMASIMKPILDQGFITEDENQRMLDGKDIWLTADDLCQRGIATHVMVKGRIVSAADYLEPR